MYIDGIANQIPYMAICEGLIFVEANSERIFVLIDHQIEHIVP